MALDLDLFCSLSGRGADPAGSFAGSQRPLSGYVLYPFRPPSLPVVIFAVLNNNLAQHGYVSLWDFLHSNAAKCPVQELKINGSDGRLFLKRVFWG